MPGNDQEVFTHLTAHPGASYEINLLTYALFADERAAWVHHFEGQHNRSPSVDETDHWIANITDQHFEHMRLKAARFFDEAARVYLQPEIEIEKTALLEATIIKEVKQSGSLLRQLGMALLTAILAPLIIGAIIAAFLAYNEVFPTFVRVPTAIEGQGHNDADRN